MTKTQDRRFAQMEAMIDALLRFQIVALTFQGLSERRIAKKLGVPRWVVRKLSVTP